MTMNNSSQNKGKKQKTITTSFIALASVLILSSSLVAAYAQEELSITVVDTNCMEDGRASIQVTTSTPSPFNGVASLFVDGDVQSGIAIFAGNTLGSLGATIDPGEHTLLLLFEPQATFNQQIDEGEPFGTTTYTNECPQPPHTDCYYPRVLCTCRHERCNQHNKRRTDSSVKI